MKPKDLDKFYTNDDIAAECLQSFLKILEKDGIEYQDYTFLEPSAGGGAFVRALDNLGLSCVAADIAPEAPKILQKDFLKDEITVEPPIIVVGNPPFGKRAALAIAFIERSLEYSDYVGFILPIQFQKFLTQKRLPGDLKLIYSEVLPIDSYTLDGKSAKVRCVFQVWARGSLSKDYRIRAAPPVKHPDFTMNTYNCTGGTKWMFDSDYDFAVLRQGWGDFTPIPKGQQLNPSKQWMFFKTDSPVVRERLLKLDFDKLSELNTSVKGFGKADVVAEYERLYG